MTFVFFSVLLCPFWLSLPCRLALIVSNSQGDLRQMRQHLKGNKIFQSSVATLVFTCVWQLPAALSDLPQITTPLTSRGDTIILCVLQLLPKLQ